MKTHTKFIECKTVGITHAHQQSLLMIKHET
jgi:hypothetical protein